MSPTLFTVAASGVLKGLVRLLPKPRIIYDRAGGTAYLSRWYLIGDRCDDQGRPLHPGSWRARLPVNVFIHRFHRSDDDGALHSHPWAWSLSFVLVGGYSEERRVGDRVVRREVLPPALNVIRGDDYHRVDLLEDDCWSIFIAGPKAGSWFFWDRDLRARLPWRDFIAAKRGTLTTPVWIDDRREDARPEEARTA